jgi:hypothetical protein|tara:strand:- start:206 stop:319 length:114 start_codon:yes stop_codon:yes gene_type:complete
MIGTKIRVKLLLRPNSTDQKISSAVGFGFGNIILPFG